VRGSPPQSSAGERSQSLPLAIQAVLRRADEHLDEIIVQRIEELALKAPFELRIVEIARMKLEVVGVNRDVFVLELDNDFNAFTLRARGEIQQWMFVEAQLSQDPLEA